MGTKLNMQYIVSKSLSHLWLVLMILALGSLADVIDYASHQDSVLSIVGLVCVAVLKATILTCLYALCQRCFLLRCLAVALIVVFSLLSFLNGLCFICYGFGISMKLFKIIMETNPTEIEEFLPELTDKLMWIGGNIRFWVCFVIFVIVWKLLPKVPLGWLLTINVTLSVVGMVYLIYACATAEFGRTNHSVFLRSGRCVASYVRDRRVIRELQLKKRPLPYPETLGSSRAAERIVVVIGESASRNHLSLYGYPLPTTPRMDTISEGLYRFDDAVASSTSTSQNMPRLLSFMTDEPSARQWYEYPSLLQIFHRLGYRTYWLSNQENSGEFSNLSSILSFDADVVKYVGGADSEDHYLKKYDDVLLPEWEKAVASNDSLQLTFLHLLGSHFQYENRYPKSQKKFIGSDVMLKMPRRWLDEKKADIVANYDNSILYTDSILSVVTESIRNADIPMILVYVSDHGESVYDNRDYRGRDPRCVNVPFIIYANRAYREKNPEIIEDIEMSLAKPFSTSELPQMLMHLTGTTYEMYDSVHDPLSVAFRPRKRWVDGEVSYQDIGPDAR